MGGFFGTIGKSDCRTDLFYGTDYNSHLGTKRAGLVTFDPERGFTRSIHSLERDYFRSRFEGELETFAGNAGIGVISDTDPQPILINSHLGRFALVSVSKINNQREIARKLMERRMHLSEMSQNRINQTELAALLVNMGNTFRDGINLVHRSVRGSCSMLILTEHSIIAARDAMGRTPVILARKGQTLAATSESTSLPNLGYEPLRDLGPGEIVELHADGTVEQIQPPFSRCQICSFLWVYYGFPASDFDGINTEAVREKIGRMMGAADGETSADCVCGVPDSGVGTALGYAVGRGIPYERGVLKYTPTWPRSFTPSKQSRRNLVAKMKLIPNRAILTGKSVVFCDDSIVRGTQLRDNVRMFFDYGARAVHARISCPPLVYGCPFVGFTASQSEMELLTRQIIRDFEGTPEPGNLDRYARSGTPEYQRMVSEMGRRLGLSSVKFNTIEALIEAIGQPKERICTHCFDNSSCDFQDTPDCRRLDQEAEEPPMR